MNQRPITSKKQISTTEDTEAFLKKAKDLEALIEAELSECDNRRDRIELELRLSELRKMIKLYEILSEEETHG